MYLGKIVTGKELVGCIVCSKWGRFALTHAEMVFTTTVCGMLNHVSLRHCLRSAVSLTGVLYKSRSVHHRDHKQLVGWAADAAVMLTSLNGRGHACSQPPDAIDCISDNNSVIVVIVSWLISVEWLVDTLSCMRVVFAMCNNCINNAQSMLAAYSCRWWN